MKKLTITGGFEVLLSDRDYSKVSKRAWQLNQNGYARTTMVCKGNPSGYKTVLMHRYILGLRNGSSTHVDHINHNKLDNRRCNLRFATQSQNLMNKLPNSGYYYKGVKPFGDNWLARIEVKGKQVFLGIYTSQHDAAAAYNKAALEAFGEFACLNQLPDGYPPILLTDFTAGRRTIYAGKPKLSKYRGVSKFRSIDKKWIAQIGIGKKHYVLGRFDTEEEAALAYNKAAKKYRKGKTIYLNDV